MTTIKVGPKNASQIPFTPAGNVAATTVQAAIEELDTEKAPKASPTLTGTVTVPDASFSLAKLANGTALSLVGRAANSVGAYADIVAGSDHQVLRRSGTGVGFGQVNLASANAVTGALPLANGGTGAVLSDPNADRMLGWDDSAGAMKLMALADFNAEAAPAAGDFLLGYTAEGAMVKINVEDLPGGGLTLVGMQVFTASGTYTPTSGMKFAWCRVQAGGGGGGGADTNGTAKASGGGGGGGEYREGVLTAADIGASKSVTVGAGGTGGSNAGGNGSAGGSSSIGTLIVANGGAGGTGTGSNTSSETPRSGGAGGSGGSGGSLSIPGEDGGLGIVIGAKGTSDIGLSNGGGSQLGRAPKTAVFMDSAGPASTGYGAGSCGATEDDSTGTGAADARPGVVIILEFA